MANKSMEFGEKEYYQVTVGHLQELQRSKEEELEALAAEFESNNRDRDAQTTTLSKEVEELRRQRQTMALSLAQYASLEAEWGAKEEEAKTAMHKLHKDNRALKKKVAKLPALEKAVAELNHDDVLRLEAEVKQLNARLQQADEQLATSTKDQQLLQVALSELKAEQQTSKWLADEQFAEREEGLQKHQKKLQEGLAMRVLRQWLLRMVARTWKAWTIYTLRRQMGREFGMVDSDDESADKRKPSQSAPQPVAPQQRIADAVDRGLSAVVNFF